MTGAKWHIQKYMVLQYSKLFYYKVSSDFLRQYWQSSCSFGKKQNLGETELSEEKNLVFLWRKISYFVFIYICISYLYIWQAIHEHIVANTFRSKKSSSALLVNEQQASQKWFLSIRHATACGVSKINIYENISLFKYTY